MIAATWLKVKWQMLQMQVQGRCVLFCKLIRLGDVIYASLCLHQQKTNPKPRGPKPSAPAGTSAAKDSSAATARPPPKLSEVSHSSDTSDDEESEDESPSKVAEQPEHGSEFSEEESSEPSPKKRRSGSAKPNAHKSKRGPAA